MCERAIYVSIQEIVSFLCTFLFYKIDQLRYFAFFLGLRSSVEDLQLAEVASPSIFEHDPVSIKSATDDKKTSPISSHEDEELKSSHSNVNNKHSASASSSEHSQKSSKHSILFPERDHVQNIQSIPSGSQSSVTIDIRQPLRLTLSNKESIQSKQRIELQEDQYVHTQVITRVASEAAAAAATSAVIAVFETQRTLLAEVHNHYLMHL